MFASTQPFPEVRVVGWRGGVAKGEEFDNPARHSRTSRRPSEGVGKEAKKKPGNRG